MKFGLVLPIQTVAKPLSVLLDELRTEVGAAEDAGFDEFFPPEFHTPRAVPRFRPSSSVQRSPRGPVTSAWDSGYCRGRCTIRSGSLRIWRC